MSEQVETRVAVLGASGYTGGELVRLLADHPAMHVVALAGRSAAGKTLGEVHPHLASLPIAAEVLQASDAAAAIEVDMVFTALPHGASVDVVPSLRAAGRQVIDLAADFRLPEDAYPEWYGFTHPAPDRLSEAVYGLPELFSDRIAGAGLVANPGCYPTPVVLGLAPLVREGLVEPDPIRVDGKTGLSGAGRALAESSLFTTTEDSIRPYRVPRHQHTPEMEHALELATGSSPKVLFTPHLVPTVRGVMITAYATLAAGASTDALTECLARTYGDRPFVRVLPPGEMADSKRTRGTNVVELQAVADPRTGTAVVVGAIDNLVKGAAGQAIQNANLILGLPEETGLPLLAVYP